MKVLVLTLMMASLATGKFFFFDGLGCKSGKDDKRVVKTIRTVEKESISTKNREVRVIEHKTTFPKKHWQQYGSVEDAGFSMKKLTTVESYFKVNNGAALLIVHDGKIVLSSGNPERRFMLHSIRKSLLSALYGINSSKIDTAKTLAELGINDSTRLTETELQARVIDLLAGRSGIYLPSAYAPKNMEKSLPTRASVRPGTAWFYNNWDFNALGSIFQKSTGLDLFDAFNKQIANPLGMEDYRVMDSYYKLEPNKSLHPAYLFKMSSRDLARFGLLYLNNGKWKDKQIVPEEWVKLSTIARTTDLGKMNDRGSFGLLWWVSDGVEGEPMYYASGLDGHRLCIFPRSNLIVVHRTDTYQNAEFSEKYLNQLLSMILQSRIPQESRKESLKNYAPTSSSVKGVSIEKKITSTYIGKYRSPNFGMLNVFMKDKDLWVDAGTGYYKMIPVADKEFIVEDMNLKGFFKPGDANNKPGTFKFIFDKNKSITAAELFY